MKRNAFTLIEVLIVVSIIVILLALLIPALDKMIYEAELAKCATSQQAVGQSAIIYAADHQKYFPHRPGVLGGPWEAAQLTDGGRSFDARPMLRAYLSLNQSLNCPLSQPVDLEGSKPSTWAYTSYSLWFGFQYGEEKGMVQLGDGVVWQGRKLDLLISDLNLISTAGVGVAISSHPDRKGQMRNEHWQDHNRSDAESAPAPFGSPISRSWWGIGGSPRGPLDLNMGCADGSMVRYNAVEAADPRTQALPLFADKTHPDWKNSVPVR